MKRLLVVTALSTALFGSMGHVQASWNNCSPYTSMPCDQGDCFNPYIGIAGGAAALSGEYRAFQSDINDTHSASLGGTDGLIGGVVGVQRIFGNCGFFAVQANFLYNTTDREVRRSTNAVGVLTHGVRIRNQFQWGADVRLGLALCGANPYILGGFESGSWRMTLSNDSAVFTRGIPPSSSIRTSRTLWGGKVGAGVTFPLYCSLWANFEYSYTWFGRVNRNLFDEGVLLTYNHRVDVRQNSFLFGINWLI